MSEKDEQPSEVKAAHNLATSLRNDGYTTGFDSARPHGRVEPLAD